MEELKHYNNRTLNRLIRSRKCTIDKSKSSYQIKKTVEVDKMIPTKPINVISVSVALIDNLAIMFIKFPEGKLTMLCKKPTGDFF